MGKGAMIRVVGGEEQNGQGWVGGQSVRAGRSGGGGYFNYSQWDRVCTYCPLDYSRHIAKQDLILKIWKMTIPGQGSCSSLLLQVVPLKLLVNA
jgi:hypothetical protein